MDIARIKEIEQQIADLKASWPAHTVRPWMWQKLEALEDELEMVKGEAKGEADAGQDGPGEL